MSPTELAMALRALGVAGLNEVLDRAALVAYWVGLDIDGDAVESCDEDDDACEKPGDCPNGGWCRNPFFLHAHTLRDRAAMSCWRTSTSPRRTEWVVYPSGGGEPVRGSAAETAEAIEQAEVAAVAAGWRLPWRA